MHFIVYNHKHFKHCKHIYCALDLNIIHGLAELLWKVDLRAYCVDLDTPTLIWTVLSADDLLLGNQKTG